MAPSVKAPCKSWMHWWFARVSSTILLFPAPFKEVRS
jgi:hypothetical protein